MASFTTSKDFLVTSLLFFVLLSFALPLQRDSGKMALAMAHAEETSVPFGAVPDGYVDPSANAVLPQDANGNTVIDNLGTALENAAIKTIKTVTSPIVWALELVFGQLIAIILWVPVFLASMYLLAAGTLFDWLVQTTIMDFSGLYATQFAGGVDATWAIFRDVGNIVMIAMFIFVAFAVILNSTSYGLKQFGVRILIIAVLLNFSLFFTKVVIDISNITAIQFGKEISNVIGDSQVTVSTAFMQMAGLSSSITGLGTLATSFSETSKAAFSQNGSLWSYVILTTIFLSATASIFLSASILLITRVISFILLMILSPLAFVAYMTPGMNGWWTQWWQHLLKNAIFAPVFMLLLLAVLRILYVPGQNNSIQSLTNTANGSWVNPEAYFKIAIVLGLFYAATKIASELSLLGAKQANKFGMGAFGRAAALLSGAGLVRVAGRNTLGRWGANNMDDKELRRRAVEGNFAQRMSARGQLAAANKAAKGTYDFRDTKIAKNLQSASGVGFGTASKKSFDSFLNKEAGFLANARGDEKEAQKEAAGAAKTVRGNGPQTEAPKTGASNSDREGAQAAELVRTPEAPKRPDTENDNVSNSDENENTGKKNQIEITATDRKIEDVAGGVTEESRRRLAEGVTVNNISDRDVIDVRSNKDKDLEDVDVVLNRAETETPTPKEEVVARDDADIIKEYRNQTGRFAAPQSALGKIFDRKKNTRDMIADRAVKIAGRSKEEEILKKVVDERMKEAKEENPKTEDKDTTKK